MCVAVRRGAGSLPPRSQHRVLASPARQDVCGGTQARGPARAGRLRPRRGRLSRGRARESEAHTPRVFFLSFPLSALSLSHVPQRTNRLALEVRVHGACVRQGREGGLGCVSPSCGGGERERAGGGRVERHTRTQAVRARPYGWVRKRHAGERDRSLRVSGDARACGHGRRENEQMEEREGAGAQLMLFLSLVLPAAAHSVRRDFWHTHPLLARLPTRSVSKLITHSKPH